MFKIGEFSKLTMVSIRMLRYYDEIGLLAPATVDPLTNYRLYSVNQIPLLNQIVFLRDIGFSIADIKRITVGFKENATIIAQELEQKKQTIIQEIALQQEKLAKITQAQKDLLQEKIGIHFNVTIKSVPGFHVFSLRRRVKDYYHEGKLWKELTQYAAEQEYPFSQNLDTFTIYHDEEYKETDIDMELCVITDFRSKNQGEYSFRKVDPVPIMAATMVYGPFENIKEGFLAAAAWLTEHHQYEMLGESRQIIHRGPWNESNPDNYLTEIQIPLKKINHK